MVNQNKEIMALRRRPGCKGRFPHRGAAQIYRSPHDHGVNGVSPLDWHYARKSGFDKYD
jgi:hypothetical protein